ncbi:MAG: 6,7-dimethyl-8-ribityllumazine synthase [Proteobacteria bacterium]|nr:6,7-dimethyl-8-ribityllumazine synthase [Pseudomonadota bacterium]
MKKIEGEMNSKGFRFAVVGARWNHVFTDRLIEGAEDALLRHGTNESDITVVRVPGCFEIPVTARELALTNKYDAIIAVGTLIKGDTDHYELISSQLTSGISKVMLDTGIPVTFGVITANTMEQALARSGSKAGNKGFEAALAAIETVQVLNKIRKEGK